MAEFQKQKTTDAQPKGEASTETRGISLEDNRVKTVQRKANNTGLPDRLKSGIENLSGHSMDDVKVHYNSNKPAQLNAHAYAQGSDIHLGAGQEKHLPHEAWHVVQQKQGRVKPTKQLKSKVNINDDEKLEKEADVMGARALQMKGMNKNENRVNSSPVNVVQRIRMNKAVTGITHLVRLVNGSLYSKDYRSNVVKTVGRGDSVVIDTDVRYRSRRGPNQERFSGVDKRGPQHYLWYKVLKLNGKPVGKDVFIREDTVTSVAQRKEVSTGFKSTIYGTDKSNPTEVRHAYDEGYRDFDCAYSYFHGNTYKIFRSFKINRGRVRLNYKFKPTELAPASAELAKLARTPGVVLHTIMLHELPLDTSKRSIDKVLSQLVVLAKTYHSKIGLSNVGQSGSGTASDLRSLRKMIASKGGHLSSVQNRMNPSTPDKAVRDYCRRHKIQYLAYGLAGPSGVGTCGAVPGVGSGDYKYLKDPEIPRLAERMGIKPGQLRQVVNTWARQSGASVITRSSDKGRRKENRTDIRLPKGTQGFIDYFSPAITPIYRPYLSYLKRAGVKGSVAEELSHLIGSGWLELYYKKVVVELGEDRLLKLLTPSQIGKLKSAPGKNKWADVTQMRLWIQGVILGTVKAAKKVIPKVATSKELIELKLPIISSMTGLEVSSLEELNKLKVEEGVAIKDGNVYYQFLSDGKGNFKREE